MRFPPADVRASWPAPNYINPERRGDTLLIIECIFAILSTLAVVLRIYTRTVVTRARLGLDDLIIGLAWIFGLGMTVGVILAVQKYGWDLHVWDVPAADNILSRKVSWACMILYLTSNCLTKTSLLIFYRRILIGKFDVLATTICLILVGLYFITTMLLLFLQCQPFGYYWEILIPEAEGTCINEGAHIMVTGSINIIVEIFIFVVPLRSLYTLKIKATQKAHVMGVFSAGILVIVGSCIRLYYTGIVYLETYDVTWYGYLAWLWSSIECQTSLICACVPACRALFISWNRQLTSGGTGSYGTAPRSFKEVDEEAYRLTATTGNHLGHHANVTSGSFKSDSDSNDYASIEKPKGVRVQTEVTLCEEAYIRDDGRDRGPSVRFREQT